MMRSGWKREAAITALRVIVAIWLLAAIPSSAEVSVDEAGNGFHVIILGVTEGPDPWSMIWVPYRDIEPSRILNSDGSARGDGRPDISSPESSGSMVVWAFRSSGDFDVAFSEWTGSEWSEPYFLTNATTDEMDPRILVSANGNAHVAWWVKQTKKLYLATRLFQSNLWGLPQEVEAPLGGARPSLVEFNARLYLAYERFSLTTDIAKDIVVARRAGAHGFVYVKVAESKRSLPNDPIMHAVGDVAWVDWKHSDDTFGYAVFENGAWGEVQTVPWLDTSWVGEEDTRLAIRAQVLGATSTDEDGPAFNLGPRFMQAPTAGRFQLPYRERYPQD